jgi:hypothetical protein
MTDSDNKDYAMSHIANLYGAATVAYVLGVMEDHKDCCAKGQNPMRILEEMMRKVDDKIVENLIENLKMRGIDLFKSHNEQLVDELLKQLEEENGNCKDPS